MQGWAAVCVVGGGQPQRKWHNQEVKEREREVNKQSGQEGGAEIMLMEMENNK